MASQVNHDINSGTLDSGEVANLLRTMQAAQFKKSEQIAEQDSSFKPRSLVDIAFDAEERRKQAQAKEAAEQAARQAEADALAQQQAAAKAEQMSEAGADSLPESDDQTEPDQQEAMVSEPVEAAEPATITQSQNDEMLATLRAELDAQAQADKEALEARLSEEHYHRGFEAGLEAAKTAEPSDEEKAHQAHMEAERQDIIQRFNAAIDAAAKMDSADISEISKAIDFAVKRLAGERAGYAIQDNPEGMVTRISELADNIATQVRVMDVYLNPDDKQAIEKWLDAEAYDHNWSLHGASELASGDIRIVAGGVELTDLLDIDELPEGFMPAPSDMAQPAPQPAPEEIEQSAPEEVAQPEAIQPESVSEPLSEAPPAPEAAPATEAAQESEASPVPEAAPASEAAQEPEASPVPQAAPVPEPQHAPQSEPAKEEVLFGPPASEGEGEFGFPPQQEIPDASFAVETGETEFAPPASEGEGEFGFPMGGRAMPSDDEA
ncbi:MAG: FliH/SctL family protein [Candidatus Puniceispirillaceae bacterium]